jgi:uncharacterized membrane-anchored protein YhcB (DUF1043 family)
MNEEKPEEIVKNYISEREQAHLDRKAAEKSEANEKADVELAEDKKKVNCKIKKVILDAYNDENGVKTVFLHGVIDEDIEIDKSRFAANVMIKKIRSNLFAPTPIATFRVVGDQHAQVVKLALANQDLEKENESLEKNLDNQKKQTGIAQSDYSQTRTTLDNLTADYESVKTQLEKSKQENLVLTHQNKTLTEDNEAQQTDISKKVDERDTLDKILTRERELKEAHKNNVIKLTTEIDELKISLKNSVAEATKLKKELGDRS